MSRPMVAGPIGATEPIDEKPARRLYPGTRAPPRRAERNPPKHPMSTQSTLEGLPKDLVVHDPAEGSVTVTVDASVYPLEALYGAAYIFIDRCYVLLDRPKGGSFSVTLTPKT